MSNRITNTRILLFLFLIPALLKAQEKKTYGPYNLFEKNITIKADSNKVTYILPDSFLIQNSEKITVNDTLLSRRIDYKINYINAEITFLKKYPPETEFSIFYKYFPFQLQESYYHQKITYKTDSAKVSREKVPAVTTRKRPAVRSSLKKNGSIVRGISLGTNQGLKVDSGLRMNISGKIADKVEVVAALSDQTTPIQPEGNTQTLSEVDKVFVQIKSDHFNATLGDYYLAFKGSEFGRYQRKLQGAMGTAKFDNYNITVSGAVSKGEYTTNKFQGQEGNQGPYQLTGDRGQIDIIVLAGTEKVWIDGVQMTRGENNDYIIEYSNGQITFTRHRLITADSRITVDFQYSDLKFQRNLYGVKTQSKLWNEKINLDLRIIREADNKDNPLDYTLSEDNLAQLQDAGDNDASSYVPGDRYVGTNKGYYIKVETDSIPYFSYVGPDSGNYNVSFSRVDDGDYNYVSFGKYEFAGVGKGEYRPDIYLEPAKSHDLADMTLALNIRKDLVIAGEFAVSRFDQNTYSNKDDDDNAGFAYLSTIKYQPDSLKFMGLKLGKLSINGKYRVVDSKFNYIDRNDEVEKNRKWDLGETALREEEIKEIKAKYLPVDKLAVAFGAGEISKGSYFNSKRWETKYDMTFPKLPQLHYKLEVIESNNKAVSQQGKWLRQSGNANYRCWKLRPFFAYSGEIKKETLPDTSKTGFKYDEFSSGLEINNFKKMSLSAALIKRDDQDFEQDAYKPKSQAQTQKYSWSYSSGRNFSVSAEYVHRDKKFADPQQNDKKTDLGDVQVKLSLFKKAVITNGQYQISNTQITKMEKVYLNVPQGEGNYHYNEQTEEYEPYELGDYILRVRQTDEFIPVVELKARSRIQFKPKLLFKKKKKKRNWQKWLSAISTDTYIRLEEKTEEDDVWAIYRLDLSKFQQIGKTIFGNSSFRQDIFVLQNNRDFSLRLRFETKNEVNYQYLEGGRETEFVERSFRLTKRLSNKFSSQLEGNSNYKSYLYSNRTDKIIEANELSLDLSFRPKQIIEFALKSKLASKKDKALDPPTAANEYSLMPRASYSFRGKGKLRMEYEWTQVSVEPKGNEVPYELVGINRNGTSIRWMIGLNYNISQYIRATLSYNGRREPDRPDTVHIGRAEMRAYF